MPTAKEIIAEAEKGLEDFGQLADNPKKAALILDSLRLELLFAVAVSADRIADALEKIADKE